MSGGTAATASTATAAAATTAAATTATAAASAATAAGLGTAVATGVDAATGLLVDSTLASTGAVAGEVGIAEAAGDIAASGAASSGLFGGLTAGNALALVGTGFSALKSVQAGNTAANVGAYNATVAKNAANQAMAGGETKSINDNMNTQLMMSRARALAASSTGSASNPSFVNNVAAPIAQQGEYNSMMDIYNGTNTANNLESQAAMDTFAGQTTQQSDYIGAGTTIMSGAASMFNRYAPDPMLAYNAGSM